MKSKIKEIALFTIPLAAIIIINYYIYLYGDMGIGKIKIKTILFILAYIGIYCLINSKNKYFNLDMLHKRRYYIVGLLFIFLVVFKIHGSSIGMWDNYYSDYGDNKPKTVITGEPRAIRSDEWLVQTPLYLSQVVEDGKLSRVNDNIRSEGQDVIVSAYSPALDITNIGKPFNWGFLFLDAERGFSWYWCSKLILLLIFSYEMAYILSRKNKKVAILGAALITFAPASQWWFSSILDLIILSQALVVSVYYYLKSKDNRVKLLNVFMFIVAGIGFVISLYPPIQVSLGYLTLIFLFYIVFSNRSKIKKKDIIIFSLATLFILTVIGYFIFTAKDALALLMGTSYPGGRIETGGNGDFTQTLNYLFGWLLPYKNVNYSNPSELSGYISLLPLIVILFFIRDKDEEDNKLKISVFIYLIIMCSFILFKYPEFLAKATLFSFVPTSRMIVTIGIGGTYFLFMLIPGLINKKNNVLKSSIITLVSLICLFIPLLGTPAKDYLGYFGIIVSIMIFGIIIYYIVRGYINEIIPFIVVFMLITGFFVNPIARGLDPIYGKEVSKAIRRINSELPGKWVALDSLVGGNFLNANGVKVFNSVHFYPDINMWEKLDKEGKYESIYNRYAHIIVDITEGENEFELIHPDRIKVKININSLKEAGIKYILTNNSLDKYNENGETIFKELYYNDIDKTFIYEYISS